MKSKVLVTTSCSDEFWPLIDLTLENKKDYCSRHGYDLMIRKHSTGFTCWERIEHMIEAIRVVGSDGVVLWMGADTLFSNLTIPVELYFNNYPGPVHICRDVNGTNNDVLILENTMPIVKEILTSVNNQKESFPDENIAMEKELLRWPGYVSYHPQRHFNSMPYWAYHYADDGGGTWQKGDYIFHAAGLGSLEAKMAEMKKILPEVVK